MASPATASSPSVSAESYVGRLLSAVSKSEMRYEGVLYHIDPHDATFGLKNVRSFGTEGRRKDGPQVLPDDRVFEYIQFRGSDIKELKVLPSPTPHHISSVLDDPAIIQTSYIPPAVNPTIAPYAGTFGTADLTSRGVPASKDSIPPFHPAGNLASISTFLSPASAQTAASPMLAHVQRLEESSTGVSFLEQQSLVGPAQGLAAVYPMTQQMQYPAFNSSIPGNSLNLHEFPQPSTPPVSLGSLFSVPNFINLAYPSNSPSSNSLVTPIVVSDNKHGILPIITSSPTMPSPFPLTANILEKSFSLPQAIDRENPVVASHLQNFPCRDAASTAGNKEEQKLSIPILGQFLQNVPANCPSSQPAGSVCEDVEVAKVLTSESRPISSKDAKAPIMPLPAAFLRRDKDSNMFCGSKKPHQWGRGDMKNGANAPSYKNVKRDLRQIWRKLDRADTPAHQISKGSPKEREEKKVGADPKSHGNTRGRSMEGGKRMNRSLQNHAIAEHFSQERGRKFKEAGYTRSSRGRVTNMNTRSIKFTDDFDFEAMNGKFNKDELWDDLSRRIKDQLKGKGNAGDSDAAKSDCGEALMSLDIKPVYVKDEFFDSLSRDRPDHKLSEQRNMDEETFGSCNIVLENRGTQRLGQGSQLKGSTSAGRGRGRGKVQAVWSKVTSR